MLSSLFAADAPPSLRDFKLTGNLSHDHAAFTLTATAHVENTKGGTLDLLSGTLALTWRWARIPTGASARIAEPFRAVLRSRG